MTRKAAAWVALVIASSLLAAWALHPPQLASWDQLILGTTGGRGAETLVRRYPLSMELPDAVHSESASPEGRSAAEQTAPTEPADAESRLGPPTAEVNRARGPAAVRESLLPVDFDVADFGTSAALDEGGQVRTNKPVVVGGSRVGTIELAVGRGASVSVDRRALAGLVGDQAPELSAALSRIEGERVTLDALRNREVAIRYDPLADALVIDTGS